MDANEYIRARRTRNSGPRKLTPAQLQALLLQQDAYYFTGGFADGTYLRKHSRETAAEYSARCLAAHYQNFFAGVVDAGFAPVFGSEPVREGGSALYEVFAEDATTSGVSLTEAMAQATLQADLYGGVVVVMDAPAVLGLTLEEQLQARAIPYLYLVAPQEWEEYAFDRNGALAYFKYFVGVDDQGRELFRSFVRVPGGSALTWATIGDAPQARVPMPVFPYFYQLGARPFAYELPISRWATLAGTAKTHFNLNSLVQTQEFMATFNILTFQGAKSDLTLSENSVLFYPSGSEKPDFISPKPETIEVLLGHLESLKEYIYQVSYQGLVMATASASGESKRWSDRMRQERLQWLARKVEGLERWVAESFAAWVGGTPASVRYPATFEQLSLTEDIDNALKLIELGVAPENQVRVKTATLLAVFSDAEPKEKEAIAAAEAANTDYGPDPEDVADNGQGGGQDNGAADGSGSGNGAE